jgi:hypothetical protein
MDDLFKVRVLTTAINNIKAPKRKIFDALYADKMHMEMSDRLAFDIISGSEGILKNISVFAPAQVTSKTGRKTVTVQAPRLSHKRFIHTAELNAVRAYGEQAALELMSSRVNRELTDMRSMIDRTLEYWAATTLQGKILDEDGTVLVDYNMTSTHQPTASVLWSLDTSNPIVDIRTWKLLIEQDHGGEIDRWIAFVGFSAMNALIGNAAVLDLLRYDSGRTIAEVGDVARLAGCEIVEVNTSYVDSAGTRQYFVPADRFVLVGYSADAFDCPYAPIIDDEAPQGVGNLERGEYMFAKSWSAKDPSGRWLKAESRPLPVLQRPGAVVYAKVV